MRRRNRRRRRKNGTIMCMASSDRDVCGRALCLRHGPSENYDSPCFAGRLEMCPLGCRICLKGSSGRLVRAEGQA